MSFKPIAVGFLALVIGIALCFAGYRAFRALIAFWGFFAGFVLTIQAIGIYSGGHFLVTIIGLLTAFIVGLIFAALAYYLYVAAVIILSASVGFWVGTGLMMAFGFSNHSTPALLVGVIFAGLIAILALALNLTKILIVVSTALGGASTIIAGVMLLLGLIPLESLSLGIVGAIISRSQSWGLAWLALAIIGIIVQLSSTRSYERGYAQAQFYKSGRRQIKA